MDEYYDLAQFKLIYFQKEEMTDKPIKQSEAQ